MAFCGNCGTRTQDGVKFCPSCGQAMGSAPAQTQAAAREEYYSPPVMPGAPRRADIRDAQENKTMAVLAYILFFIPLLTGAHKTSEFARYHTNQGTVLAIAGIIWGIAYGILSVILLLIPYVGWALLVILGLASFIFPIFCVVGIINAVNGQMKPLPLIGKITIIK